MPDFSDYIVFVDESGTPTLKNIDKDFPYLVLAFLIVKKTDYADAICPKFQAFKFSHFGHNQVILHERDIRRDLGAFSFLKDKIRKQNFLDELTQIIEDCPLHLTAVVIRKDALKAKYVHPENPYHLALKYGMERVSGFIHQKGDAGTLHIVAEKRGDNEDGELELEFRRICHGENYRHHEMPFELIFSDKKSNSTGLQLADLMARPIGMSILKPEQNNRAVDVLKNKLIRYHGKADGWGLKVFP